MVDLRGEDNVQKMCLFLKCGQSLGKVSAPNFHFTIKVWRRGRKSHLLVFYFENHWFTWGKTISNKLCMFKMFLQCLFWMINFTIKVWRRRKSHTSSWSNICSFSFSASWLLWLISSSWRWYRNTSSEHERTTDPTHRMNNKPTQLSLSFYLPLSCSLSFCPSGYDCNPSHKQWDAGQFTPVWQEIAARKQWFCLCCFLCCLFSAFESNSESEI